MRRLVALTFAVLLAPALAGCFSGENPADPTTPATRGAWPNEDQFVTTDANGKPLAYSQTLVAGIYELKAPEIVNVFSFDGTALNVGIWRPDVPDGTRVPVIMDTGPYYLDGDVGVGEKANRLGGFLIDTFVPHGYAVVQASIRGTGNSAGCVDYMGEKEQQDMDALVTYFGEQDWSNGAVAMIGRSYDGSTPWEAATFGNPYLKTIVPISGISDLGDLHYHNGSAESRAFILGSLYYSYGATNAGLDGVESDPTNLPRMACAEGPQHAPMGAAGYTTGGSTPADPLPYWQVRDFGPRVLENYEGSLFYIHGLQDWNVRPNQGADLYNAFPGAKKALLGQWGHNYPDRPDEHEHLRYDWAEMLLRWFDRELKGLDVDTGPDITIEDHRGNWRTEPYNAWPPQDATTLTLRPTVNGSLTPRGAEGTATLFRSGADPTTGETPLGGRTLRFESKPFDIETRISGAPTFHVTITPQGSGGHLFATLIELPTQGDAITIGRAQMDLHYRDGGKTYKPLTPGETVLAQMQFLPLDAHIPNGSRLALIITQEVNGDPTDDPLPTPFPTAETTPATIHYGDDLTNLNLPIIERTTRESRWNQKTEANN